MLLCRRMTTQSTFTDPETYAIIGAAMEVHRVMGCGFLESVYRKALAIEFTRRGIPFSTEVPLDISYKGERLPVAFRADFLCYSAVLVEAKALPLPGAIEQAQVINYLKATGLHRAILLNFGTTSLQHRRIVRHLRREDDPRAHMGEIGGDSSAPGVVVRNPLAEGPQKPARIPGDGDGGHGPADSAGQ